MDVVQTSVEAIRPYDHNPRVNDQAVDAVVKSIQEFGFRVPIVVDDQGVVIMGHTRLKAAKKMGLTHVPVHVAVGLPADKVRALRIADNKTHELATWDNDLLALELGELKAVGYDMEGLGFSSDDLQELLAPAGTSGLTDPDEVPPLPAEAITKPGDVWVLGQHRLMCGDSSLPADLDRLLAGEKINLVNTDPPYNVNVAPRGAVATGEQSAPVGEALRPRDRPIANDSMSDAEFIAKLDSWFGNAARVLMPGGSIYLWGGYANCERFPAAMRRAKLHFSQAIIWVKEHPVINRKDFMGNHEWCFYGWREGAAHRFFGPNNVPDTWSVKKVHPGAMVHLTEKPVDLAKRAIEYSSRAGESVLDLFGGSGSTMIAAEMTGRRAFLMELDALYCDVIVKRWEDFTGRKAVRSQPATSEVAGT